MYRIVQLLLSAVWVFTGVVSLRCSANECGERWCSVFEDNGMCVNNIFVGGNTCIVQGKCTCTHTLTINTCSGTGHGFTADGTLIDHGCTGVCPQGCSAYIACNGFDPNNRQLVLGVSCSGSNSANADIFKSVPDSVCNCPVRAIDIQTIEDAINGASCNC